MLRLLCNNVVLKKVPSCIPTYILPAVVNPEIYSPISTAHSIFNIFTVTLNTCFLNKDPQLTQVIQLISYTNFIINALLGVYFQVLSSELVLNRYI